MTVQTPQSSGTPPGPAEPWSTVPAPTAPNGGRRLLIGLIVGLLVLAAACAVAVALVLRGDGSTQTTPVSPHRAEAGEPALVAVPGYAYEDVSDTDLGDLNSMMEEANRASQTQSPELGPVYSGWSGHEVVQGGREVGRLVLMAINPAYLSSDTFSAENVLARLAGGVAQGGATVRMGTLVDHDVVFAEADGTYGVAWLQDGTIVEVAGPDRSDVRNFATDYLEVVTD